MRGRDFEGVGEAFEGEAAEDGVLAVLRTVPAYQRYWRVELDETGRPKKSDVIARIARENALVRIRNLSLKGHR